MHETPARQILTHTMEWTTKDVTENLAELQVLSDYGYDEYQQFRPGMRFIESLARWLNQFPIEERSVAFEFVKRRLLYITQDQMRQIISITYDRHVVPILLKQMSELDGRIPYWHVKRLRNLNKFRMLQRQCLFVGLSDGSRIDTFRRYNSEISNEQIYRAHEINRTRAENIKKELRTYMEKNYNLKQPDARFCNLFLLDDFSASGTTYLRPADPGQKGEWSGKLAEFCNAVKSKHDPIASLVDIDDLRIWLILYVATERAKEHLKECGKKLFKDIEFSVVVTHTIPDSIKYEEDDDPQFTKLIRNKDFGWKGLESNIHMRRGGTAKLYLGYGDCALPLILDHNTPNNSLPILHRADENVKFQGLFPRVDRRRW